MNELECSSRNSLREERYFSFCKSDDDISPKNLRSFCHLVEHPLEGGVVCYRTLSSNSPIKLVYRGDRTPRFVQTHCQVLSLARTILQMLHRAKTTAQQSIHKVVDQMQMVIADSKKVFSLIPTIQWFVEILDDARNKIFDFWETGTCQTKKTTKTGDSSCWSSEEWLRVEYISFLDTTSVNDLKIKASRKLKTTTQQDKRVNSDNFCKNADLERLRRMVYPEMQMLHRHLEFRSSRRQAWRRSNRLQIHPSEFWTQIQWCCWFCLSTARAERYLSMLYDA